MRRRRHIVIELQINFLNTVAKSGFQLIYRWHVCEGEASRKLRIENVCRPALAF